MGIIDKITKLLFHIETPPASLGLFHPITMGATFFGSGLITKMAGTVGSAAALPPAFLIAYFIDPLALIPAGIIAFLVGMATAGKYADAAELKDPNPVVIDEVAGQFITLALIPANPVLYIVGFFLFRLLDIVKPGPAGWADKNLDGALGIMVDDVISGVMGMIILWVGYWGYLTYVG